MIRKAQPADRLQLAAMRALLWPNSSLEEHLSEADALLSTETSGTMPATVFVSQDADGALTGFVEVGLRSHADGCDAAHPVGFIEGWFVRQENRGRGLGRELMRAAEEWCRRQRCRELASDALIDNESSQNAHQALGFEVVDRCVHYRKPLQDSGAIT
jgi:aminoglycoside 6'-N-acetyltransferase I